MNYYGNPILNESSTLISWLLTGDVSIQYQVYRDLLGVDKLELQKRIANEGWGAKLLSLRKANGHWGRDFYQPKWISSHYTLLDLKNLGIAKDIKEIKETIGLILKTRKSSDGGINPAKTVPNSDVCVNGMFLNYASYFEIDEVELKSIVDFLLLQQMPDGGFNCFSNQGGAKHSSLHTTISVLEGILEFSKNGYQYRLDELKKSQKESEEFILDHQLFKSHRTGQIIDKRFLMLSYPSRWRYDILRALDYFQSSNLDCRQAGHSIIQPTCRMAGDPIDSRMIDAVEVLLKKRCSNGTWPLQAKHPGQTHFDMEKTGNPSRWNTLRALRVLKWVGINVGV
jgi:hypothetical protein